MVRHQPVGWLKTRHAEAALPPGDGQYFRISKAWLIMRGPPPVRQFRGIGEKIIEQDVQFGEVML